MGFLMYLKWLYTKSSQKWFKTLLNLSSLNIPRSIVLKEESCLSLKFTNQKVVKLQKSIPVIKDVLLKGMIQEVPRPFIGSTEEGVKPESNVLLQSGLQQTEGTVCVRTNTTLILIFSGRSTVLMFIFTLLWFHSLLLAHYIRMVVSSLAFYFYKHHNERIFQVLSTSPPQNIG